MVERGAKTLRGPALDAYRRSNPQLRIPSSSQVGLGGYSVSGSRITHTPRTNPREHSSNTPIVRRPPEFDHVDAYRRHLQNNENTVHNSHVHSALSAHTFDGQKIQDEYARKNNAQNRANDDYYFGSKLNRVPLIEHNRKLEKTREPLNNYALTIKRDTHSVTKQVNLDGVLFEHPSQQKISPLSVEGRAINSLLNKQRYIESQSQFDPIGTPTTLQVNRGSGRVPTVSGSLLQSDSQKQYVDGDLAYKVPSSSINTRVITGILPGTVLQHWNTKSEKERAQVKQTLKNQRDTNVINDEQSLIHWKKTNDSYGLDGLDSNDLTISHTGKDVRHGGAWAWSEKGTKIMDIGLDVYSDEAHGKIKDNIPLLSSSAFESHDQHVKTWNDAGSPIPARTKNQKNIALSSFVTPQNPLPFPLEVKNQKNTGQKFQVATSSLISLPGLVDGGIFWGQKINEKLRQQPKSPDEINKGISDQISRATSNFKHGMTIGNVSYAFDDIPKGNHPLDATYGVDRTALEVRSSGIKGEPAEIVLASTLKNDGSDYLLARTWQGKGIPTLEKHGDFISALVTTVLPIHHVLPKLKEPDTYIGLGTQALNTGTFFHNAKDAFETTVENKVYGLDRTLKQKSYPAVAENILWDELASKESGKKDRFMYRLDKHYDENPARTQGELIGIPLEIFTPVIGPFKYVIKGGAKGISALTRGSVKIGPKPVDDVADITYKVTPDKSVDPKQLDELHTILKNVAKDQDITKVLNVVGDDISPVVTNTGKVLDNAGSIRNDIWVKAALDATDAVRHGDEFAVGWAKFDGVGGPLVNRLLKTETVASGARGAKFGNNVKDDIFNLFSKNKHKNNPGGKKHGSKNNPGGTSPKKPGAPAKSPFENIKVSDVIKVPSTSKFLRPFSSKLSKLKPRPPTFKSGSIVNKYRGDVVPRKTDLETFKSDIVLSRPKFPKIRHRTTHPTVRPTHPTVRPADPVTSRSRIGGAFPFDDDFFGGGGFGFGATGGKKSRGKKVYVNWDVADTPFGKLAVGLGYHEISRYSRRGLRASRNRRRN